MSIKIDSILNSDKGSLEINFDEKVKVNPKFATNIKSKINVFLNGTCQKTDFKYSINIIKDRQGYETVRVNYVLDFNVPEKS